MPARPEQHRPRGGELLTAGTPSPTREDTGCSAAFEVHSGGFFSSPKPLFLCYFLQAFQDRLLAPQSCLPSPAQQPVPSPQRASRGPGTLVLEREERCERLLYLCLVNNALVCTYRSLQTQGTVLYLCQAAEPAAAPSAAAPGGRGAASAPPLGSFLPTNPAFYS